MDRTEEQDIVDLLDDLFVDSTREPRRQMWTPGERDALRATATINLRDIQLRSDRRRPYAEADDVTSSTPWADVWGEAR